ncbi:hypothetical protein BASA81_004115 [Batrachochytrium salamandrivorans]|nr:hypothetical protein BASA81_004115 [Batrachochytrium salamandrivorans]
MGEQQMKRARHSGADAEGVARVLPLFAGESALFYDLDAFEQTLLALQRAFPPHFRHTLAVKANPLPAMLRLAVEGFGFGLECASLPEVELSRAGCAPGLVMFDSPCKTVADLRRALEAGVQINCDSFDEVERVARLLGGAASASAVAVRINPLLGFGAIRRSACRTPRASSGSRSRRRTRPSSWRCSRGTASSPGCTCTWVAGVLAGHAGRGRERRARAGPQARALHAAGLGRRPAHQLRLGRVHAHVRRIGWAVSRCEYVKLAERTRIAVIHFGSDMFLRTCYVPDQFALRVQVFDKDTCEQKTKALDAGWTQNVVVPLVLRGRQARGLRPWTCPRSARETLWS